MEVFSLHELSIPSSVKASKTWKDGVLGLKGAPRKDEKMSPAQADRLEEEATETSATNQIPKG